MLLLFITTNNTAIKTASTCCINAIHIIITVDGRDGDAYRVITYIADGNGHIILQKVTKGGKCVPLFT